MTWQLSLWHSNIYMYLQSSQCLEKKTYNCRELIIYQYVYSLFPPRSSKPMRAVGRLAKYPLIDADYSVVGSPHMYVIGAASHSLDFRRSAGGFIHGFRYTGFVLSRVSHT